jgi:hypothetical protein
MSCPAAAASGQPVEQGIESQLVAARVAAMRLKGQREAQAASQQRRSPLPQRAHAGDVTAVAPPCANKAQFSCPSASDRCDPEPLHQLLDPHWSGAPELTVSICRGRYL